MAKEIDISRGMAAIVDDEDFEIFNEWKWYGNRKNNGVYYVSRTKRYGPRKEGKQRVIYLHREIIGAKEGEYVDHINGNPLDNRKENLRICTNAQNGMNHRGQPSRRISKYKGVKKNRNCNTWCARIFIDQKEHYLGCFKTEEEAAKKYNEKAKELFGEFALLNEV